MLHKLYRFSSVNKLCSGYLYRYFRWLLSYNNYRWMPFPMFHLSFAGICLPVWSREVEKFVTFPVASGLPKVEEIRSVSNFDSP